MDSEETPSVWNEGGNTGYRKMNYEREEEWRVWMAKFRQMAEDRANDQY